MRIPETMGKDLFSVKRDSYICAEIWTRGVEFNRQGGSKDCVRIGLIAAYDTKYAVARGKQLSAGYIHIPIWE